MTTDFCTTSLDPGCGATVVIREVDPLGADAMALLREAALDARTLYPELFTDRSLPPTNHPLSERSAYVVAYIGEAPLACGSIMQYETTVAEVRRMYVHREHRRLGLGRAVLARLLTLARQLGYRTPCTGNGISADCGHAAL